MSLLRKSIYLADKASQSYLTRGVRKLNRILLNNPNVLDESYGEFLDPWHLEETREPRADIDSLNTFKDKHKGERCFVIGNGPSLNKHDLSLLADDVTFGVNSIFLKAKDGFQPTYYTVEDGFVMDDNSQEIANFKAKHRFFPTVYRKYFENPKDTSFFLMNRGFYDPASPFSGMPRFSKNCARRIYTGQSVTYINLQLAFFMGFKTVYLIGMDFSYKIPDSVKRDGVDFTSTEDDPNHFDSSYFGPGKRWHDPQLDKVKRSYEYAELVYKWHGRQIVNATVGGQLDVFKRTDYKSLF